MSSDEYSSNISKHKRKSMEKNDENSNFKRSNSPKSTKLSKRSRSRSPKRSHRNRSKSPSKNRRNRSKSISKVSKSHRRRSRSKSTSRRRKSRSKSINRRKRSNSRSKRRKSVSKNRRKSKSHSRSRRNRSKSHESRNKRRNSRSRSGRRRGRNSDEDRPRRRTKSPENYYAPECDSAMSEEDKDARTVNVWQLSHKVRTRDLEEFFGKIGKLRVVRLIMDPRSGRSRGVAYIQFQNIESVDKALGTNGTRLMGVPIQIRTVSSEKCRAAEASMKGGIFANKGPAKLCIMNLNVRITQANLEDLFTPYGTVKEVQLLKNINGESLGTAFVTFYKGENAQTAMDQLNGFEVAGNSLKITPMNETTYGSDFADNEGIYLNSNERLGLMAKLSVGTGLQLAPTSKTDNSNAVISTQCFVLSKMFNVEDTKDEKFCVEVYEDVVSECLKFGGAVHVHVDRRGASGNVYVKCVTVPVAVQCVNSLNGRSFDGKVIEARYIPLSIYSTSFPDSVNATRILKLD